MIHLTLSPLGLIPFADGCMRNLKQKLLLTSPLEMGEGEEKETTWQKAEAAFTGYALAPVGKHIGQFRRHSSPADVPQQEV